MLNSDFWLSISVVIFVIGLPTITCSSIRGHHCEVKYNPAAVQGPCRQPADYQSSGPAPLRLTIVYTENFKRIPNYWHIAQTQLEPGFNFWRSALAVKKPLKKPLKVRRKCHGDSTAHLNADGQYEIHCTHGCVSSQVCHNVAVPRQYLDNCKVTQNGLPASLNDGGYGAANTDYLVFVDYKPGGCGDSTVAYAVHCQTDKNTDRPEIGMINYCPHNIQFTEANKNYTKSTTIHELAHALGFTWYNVPYMRNDDNSPRTRRDPTWNHPIEGQDSAGHHKPNVAAAEEVTRWWLTAEKWVPRTTKILKTPNVLAAARAHFNCPTLEGVELENNGGVGTADSHFEKHLYYDEVMVGSTTGQETVSALTLGFFKDTGWYNVNNSMAEPIKFGKGLGCEFATQSCYQYVHTKQRQNQSPYPWCNSVGHYCRLDKKFCTLGKMSAAMPEAYRYVTPSKAINKTEALYYAGSDWLMDYCPFEMPCGQRR